MILPGSFLDGVRTADSTARKWVSLAGMASHSADGPGEAGGERARIYVEDATGRRPFMRGILIHSLMAQGVSYEDAYGAANAVRDRVLPKGTVNREEIMRLVTEALGPGAAPLQRVRVPDSILVTGQGDGTPFSKGFLSQSSKTS